jgi:DNA-binding transcriptional MerR regulator
MAKKIGVSADAIRFYERKSLLPRPPRTQGGFRKYDESDGETLAFMRRVQGLGFTLDEVRELLNLRHSRLQSCWPVRRQVEQKAGDVRRKLADLRKLDAMLFAVASARRASDPFTAHSLQKPTFGNGILRQFSSSERCYGGKAFGPKSMR